MVLTCTAQSEVSKVKIKQTKLERYGDENYTNREKAIQTNIERFGVEHAAQNKEVQEKTKQTNFIRYGCHPRQTEEVKTKQKLTCLDTYGVDNPFLSTTVQTKIKQTNLERYGGHPSQHPDVREKVCQTNITNCGVDNPRKSQLIKDQIKQTNVERFGAGSWNQEHMIDTLPLIEDSIWMENEYINLKKTSAQIADELGIGSTAILRYLRKHNIEIRKTEQSSFKSFCWLESIMEAENIHIQHSQNGGEYHIPGMGNCRADGYCAESNTIYEFYGDYWHGNPNVFEFDYYNDSMKNTMGNIYQATIERENKIKNLGYNIITMWESDYNKL